VPAGSTVVVLRLENEAEEILHYMMSAGVEPDREYVVDEHAGDGDNAVTRLTDDGGAAIEVEGLLARTVSVRVVERGSGGVSRVGDAGAELQLLGHDRWGM
jgi:hypothetical protein